MQLDEILANLSDLSGDAVAVGFRGPGDKTAHFVWTNRHFLELFGYEPREVIGQPVEMQHDPQDADLITRDIHQQLNKNGFSRTEVRCLRKDGSKFWASLAVRPQDAHDRQGRYTVAVYREIDELKSREAAAEAALQERDRAVAKLQGVTDRLVTAINTIPDAFAIYDRDTRLVLWNAAYACSMTDDPTEIQVGMHVEDVLRLANARGRFAEANGRVEEWLNSIRATWIEGRGTVKMNIDDRLFHVYRNTGPSGDTVVLRVDVTELEEHRKKAEEYARQVEEAYREISYQATHDLSLIHI